MKITWYKKNNWKQSGTLTFASAIQPTSVILLLLTDNVSRVRFVLSAFITKINKQFKKRKSLVEYGG